MRILVVDDDEEMLSLVGRALTKEGHHVTLALETDPALAAVGPQSFDVVILDVMLGNESGLAACARMRERGVTTPVLFLSARGAVRAKLEGFAAGGDDYMSKPFALSELIARVHALGRRAPGIRPVVVKVNRVVMDFGARRVIVDGREIPTTAREWEVLRVLAAAEGRVVPFRDILDSIWGESSSASQSSLEVIISRLRKKLESEGEPVLRTVRGVGYALEVAR